MPFKAFEGLIIGVLIWYKLPMLQDIKKGLILCCVAFACVGLVFSSAYATPQFSKKFKSEFVDANGEGVAIVESNITLLLPLIYDLVFMRNERMSFEFYTENKKKLECAVYPKEHIHTAGLFDDDDCQKHSNLQYCPANEVVEFVCTDSDFAIQIAPVQYKDLSGKIQFYELTIGFYNVLNEEYLGATKLPKIAVIDFKQ